MARRGRKPDLSRRGQAAELRAQGLTFVEVGRRLGITPTGARRLLRAAAGPPSCASCAGPLPARSRGGRCPACVAADPAAPFAERLRALRLAAGLTLAGLAGRAGLCLTSVSVYERGRARPRPRSLVALARVLGPGLLAGTGGAQEEGRGHFR
jgi:transcriptional regulator with XRE-family HTH domain